MKKIKTTLLLLSISFLSFYGFGQTQEFTDEASFLAALNGVVPALEDYENCPTFMGFDFTASSGSSVGCRVDCGIGNTSYGIREEATFVFDTPMNVFGTFLFDLGDFGNATTLTLMTNDGQSYTAAFGPGDDGECNERFFGIISEMDFTMAIINNSYPPDFVYLDNTYYGRFEVAPIPTLSQWGIIALSMIMLIFGLIGLKQRKVIFG